MWDYKTEGAIGTIAILTWAAFVVTACIGYL
jgi:hypothetical protein